MTALLAMLAVALPAPAPNMEQRRAHVSFPADPRVKVVRPYRSKLARMARCESTGRWHVATGNGFYGGLQFDARTWWSVGGRGLPHWHSRLEQSYRAVLLIRRRGYSPWPVCGGA